MAEENGVAEDGMAEYDTTAPAGPFLREYTPTGSFRHSGARTTSVLFYRNGGYSVAGVSGVRHYDKRALARPHTICEIATGTFVTTLQMELPAAGGATFFKAEVDIQWTVEDPHLVAVQAVTDVAQRLTAPTLERLRQISAQFPVNQAESANSAITQQCVSGRWSDLGSDIGLRVRLFVRLRVDDRTIGHVEKVRDQQGASALARMRQEDYLRMLRGGELEQLSHMLAADPAAANSFLEKIRQEGRQDEKDRVDRLFDMVASGQIPSSELDAQALAYLNSERLRIQGPVGSRPAQRAPRELESGRDEPFTPEWVEDRPPSRPARRDGDGRGGGDRSGDRRGSDGRGGGGRGGDGRGGDGRDGDRRRADDRHADDRHSDDRRDDGRRSEDQRRDDRHRGDRRAGPRDPDRRTSERRDPEHRDPDRRDPDRRDAAPRDADGWDPDGWRTEPRYADDVRDARDARYADDVQDSARDDVRDGARRDGARRDGVRGDDVRRYDARDPDPDPPAPRGRTRDDGWVWAADE
ncbi:hypothetical protein [Streptomyces sp. NPDC007346]|uniref:hypothetical protein n=1 Tax=Streptomyces sp. NPDC007346 TaxID=3154682 RepID=UPI003455B0DD